MTDPQLSMSADVKPVGRLDRLGRSHAIPAATEEDWVCGR